jgi:hypothetical protein
MRHPFRCATQRATVRIRAGVLPGVKKAGAKPLDVVGVLARNEGGRVAGQVDSG